MKNKFFFVIYFHDKSLKTLLDALRLIADSQQRNYSHITVKGPYKTYQKKRLKIDSEEINGTHLKISGAGNFFEAKQNTVFLKCDENEELYNIWKAKEEKTYKEFHPHITIYDGDDRKFAQKIYEIIDSYDINFDFEVEELELYSTRDKDSLFNLRNAGNFSFISEIASVNINNENIDKLSKDERLRIIEIVCADLGKLINKRKSFSTRHHQENQKDSGVLFEV